jgi:hypothetical protein
VKKGKIEGQMYPKVEAFLKKRGYKILREKTFLKNNIGIDIGQESVTPDVIGYKDNDVWIIECKQPCTIEQFGFVLGQLACDKWLFDKHDLLRQRIGRVKTIKYSVALLEKGKYQLTSLLLETFKAILSHYRLSFGFLKMNVGSDVVEEVLKPCNRSMK